MIGFENAGKLLRLLHGGEERTVQEIMSDFNTIFPPSLHFYACPALELLLDPETLLPLFISVPNAIGFVLGTSQLVLYAIYRNPKASKKIAADLEDGRQRKPLLSNPEEK
ncbi:bidirectional sugar transporter SWEET17 [Olea europaea subsp. europaea]|uniref:Bidirectional sugar transporter SWEET17 n=1 Tax=Olea europaea subsp. europaea TaxID=158383 RepID=A0A8S0PLE4_OLEEU|nr:bidirectional sugar transporter SWEET17 [Olea europaea subsp. europaea]